MSRQARFGQAKMMQCMPAVSKERFHFCAAIQIQTVHTPGRDCHVRPCRAEKNDSVIGRPDWLGCFSQARWVRFPPCKNICRTEPAKPERARPSFAPFNRWIVLLLCRFGRIEHDEHHLGRGVVPNTCKAVAVTLAWRIFRNRLDIVLLGPFGKDIVSQG